MIRVDRVEQPIEVGDRVAWFRKHGDRVDVRVATVESFTKNCRVRLVGKLTPVNFSELVVMRYGNMYPEEVALYRPKDAWQEDFLGFCPICAAELHSDRATVTCECGCVHTSVTIRERFKEGRL